MRLRITFVLSTLLLLVAIFLVVFTIAYADNSIFSDPVFQKIWEHSDKAVLNGNSNRPWLWGPAPFDARLEPYTQAPNGERQVQYFDKARMEISNPTADRSNLYYVTNGLLTVELVSGKMQLGDSTFLPLTPSATPVAGDEDDQNGPTYASFSNLATLNNDHPAADRTGQTVNEFINRQGQVSTLQQPPTVATCAYFSPELGHNIPDLFWKWLGGLDVPWQFAMGLPISEPYWAQVKVAGNVKYVLIQLFQRRVLTYTPDNPAAFQVEMGNIGRHYWSWRYQSNPPTPVPTSTPTSTPIPVAPVFAITTSDEHPNVGSVMTVTVKLMVDSKAAQGATVHAVWNEKKTKKTFDTFIDQDGLAFFFYKVPRSEKSITVKVDLSATYQGRTYTGSVQYQPK